VVGRFDLDHAVAAGEPTGQTNGIERGLCAAVGEAPLRLCKATMQLLSHDDVVCDRLREMRAPADLRFHRGDDRRMRMAPHHDTEPVVEVDVLVAVDVPDRASLPAIDEHRLRGRVLKRAGHTTRDHAGRLLPQLSGTLAASSERLLLLRDQVANPSGSGRAHDSGETHVSTTPVTS